jgi:hypothetical protein
MNSQRISRYNNRLFDITKSSSTFMNLMLKYNNNRKNRMRNKGKGIVAKAIDEKKFKLEQEEKDGAYIYKEAKNISHINQELINTYGIKAKSQIYDTSKFSPPIKIGKKQFFDPTAQYNLQNSASSKILTKGIINLPLISKDYAKYNKKSFMTLSNPKIIKRNNNSNNIFKNIKANTDYSFESNKKSNSNSPIKNKFDSSETEINMCPSSFRSKNSDNNILLTEVIKNTIFKNNNKKRNNFYLNNRDIFSYNGSYLASLSCFKDQLINDEKKQRNYFYRNDYGCNLFKEKYNYLSDKYFKSD